MSELTTIAQLLDELGCHSYSLHVTDSGYYADRNPERSSEGRVSLHLTIIGRTAFEAVADAIGAKPKERIVHVGQRSWWAEADTKTRRLLIEGVSFQHHDDWQPRGEGA